MITESENMQESAENDESQTWKSRWGIEQPTTSEMRDNRWMVRRVVQARETQAQVRLAEEQAAAWVESRPSRSAKDDFLRLPFSRSATGDDRQSFQRPQHRSWTVHLLSHLQRGCFPVSLPNTGADLKNPNRQLDPALSTDP